MSDAESPVFVADPFGRSPRQYFVPAGTTVAVIVGRALTADGMPREMFDLARAYIGDIEIPRERWTRVRPKLGATVTVMMVPLGSTGKKIGLTIAAIAIAVLSYGTGSYVSESMLAAGYSSSAASAGAAMAAAGVSMVGGVMLRALAAPGSDSGSSRYSIDSVGNQPLEKNKPIPVLLGRRRVYPRIAATTWTECCDIDATSSNDVYLNMIVLWNAGPVALSDLKIGETPISEYHDVTIDHHLYPDNLPAAIYNIVVREDLISTEVRRSYGWVQRRTRTETTKIGVTLSFPAGLYSKKGKAFSVNMRLQYKPVDSDAWQDTPAGGVITVNRKEKQPFYKNYEWTVPSGQYDVRIMRINNDDWDLDNDDQGTQQTTAFWLRLHSYNSDKIPIAHPELFSWTALRIRATNQVNGTLDKLNAVVTSVVPKWNGTKFDENTLVASRNPAELFHWYATSGVTALPQGGAIDDAALGAWAEQCEKNKWYCDALIETGSMHDVLNALAVAGQGFGDVWEDGLLSVAIDDEKPAPVQIFSARNVHNFRGQILYPDEIHAVNVVFDDATCNYQSQTRTVYAPGYTADNATLFETIDCTFKTDPREAYIYGWRYLSARILRPEIYTFDTWTEGLVVRYGKRVDISHWRMSVGIQGSRIRDLITDASGLVTGLMLDDAVSMVPGREYILKVQSGSSIGAYEIIAQDGASDTLTLVTPVPAENFGVPGNHCIFGERDKETLAAIVVGIDVHTDKTTTLTCIPYAPGMLANGGDIPAWNPQISARQPGNSVVTTRPLSPADQDALIDRYLTAVAGAAAEAAGAATDTAVALNGMLAGVLDTDGFATAEQLAAALVDVDAAHYDSVKRVSDTLEVSSAVADAKISQVKAVAIGAQETVAQLSQTVSAGLAGNAGAIAQEAQARADSDSALSTTINNLSATVGKNAGAIAQEAQIRADSVSALSTTVNNLSATVGQNSGAIAQEAQARATADSALSDALTKVSSSVGNIAASGYLRTTASVDGGTGVVTVGLAAVASKSDVTTKSALMLRAGTDGTSTAAILANAFFVCDQNGNQIAMFDSSGKVNVGSMVAKGSITNVNFIQQYGSAINLKPSTATVMDTSAAIALTSGTNYTLWEVDVSPATDAGTWVQGTVTGLMTSMSGSNTISINFDVSYDGGASWSCKMAFTSAFIPIVQNELFSVPVFGLVPPGYNRFRITILPATQNYKILTIQAHSFAGLK